MLEKVFENKTIRTVAKAIAEHVDYDDKVYLGTGKLDPVSELSFDDPNHRNLVNVVSDPSTSLVWMP